MRHLCTALLLTLALVASAIAAPPPQTVRVSVEDAVGLSHGTGTLIRSDLIITNWHVVRDQKGSVTIYFPDWTKRTATVVKTDKTWDLAALRIEAVTTSPVELGEVPKRGDIVMVGGYGSGDYKAASGPVLGFYSPANSSVGDIIQVGAQVRPGDSGGGMFKDGKLVGVLFGCQSDGTYGSHVGRVRWFLEGVE